MEEAELKNKLVQIVTGSNGLYKDLKPEAKKMFDSLMDLYRENATNKCVDCGKYLVRCENCERLWQT